MELSGCKQATAHAHVQSHYIRLNFENTKNSNRSKKSAATKIKFESANEFRNTPKSFEFISGGMVFGIVHDVCCKLEIILLSGGFFGHIHGLLFV